MIRFTKVVKALVLIFFVFLSAYFLRGPSYPKPFEVTNISDHIQYYGKQNFSGAVLVNVDQDEEEEIFITGHGTHNLILKRNKNLFTPLNLPELSDPNGLTFSVTACDINQDGRDEILIINRPDNRNHESHSRIVKYENGKWTDILSKDDPITKSLEFGYSATCIDRKGNGKYGLAVTHEDGRIVYLEMIDSKVTDIASQIGVALHSKGRSILGVPGPNGFTNIFVGNESGKNFYFVNNGDGVFAEKASETGLSDPDFNARGISLIDINYDDMPDIIYGNSYGPTRLLEQTRDGKFKDVAPEDMKEAYAVNAAVVGDFNLDGYEDVYLNNFRGNNKTFARYKNEWFELNVDEWAEKDMFGISTIAGDLDDNGSFDILNTHGDGAQFPITLYTVKPINKWIKFLVTYSSGGIPRGSMVRIRTTKRDHVRVLSTGSGRFANYETKVTFGLLKNEKVVSAEVILPSGKKVEFKEQLNLLKTNKLVIPSPQESKLVFRKSL